MFPAIRSGLHSFEGAILAVRRLSEELPLRVTATNAFASRWLVPRLPQWRKLRASVPLEVIGTDSVLDLGAGDSDVAIRYATSRAGNPAGVAEVLLTDTFWPVYNPELLSPARLKRPADLAKYQLIHAYWAPGDRDPPTWRRWLNAARRKWPDAPDYKDMQHLSFREESHAIEAVVGGQGVGLFSDALVARELAAGTLVRAFDLSMPGYRFYVVRRPDHPREKQIRAFASWLKSAI